MLLIAAGALAIPAGCFGWRPVTVELDVSAPAVAPLKSPAPALKLDSASLVIVERNAFRLSRAPAEVAFQLVAPEPVHVEPPPPKPQLVLSGIVWGVEPSALLEGIPGIEGVKALRVGEAAGPVTVRRITADRVTLVGMDTTWVLAVRKPW